MSTAKDDLGLAPGQSITDLTFDDLDHFAAGRHVWSCIQCGTCVGTCPHGEYMEFAPRRIIAMLRAGLIDEVLKSDSLLKCVTCYACMIKCPMDIKLTEVLLPLVKESMFEHLETVPAELQQALQNTLRYGNALGQSPKKRADWVKTCPVPVRIMGKDPAPADVLWLPECYAAYHPRDRTTAVRRLGCSRPLA